MARRCVCRRTRCCRLAYAPARSRAWDACLNTGDTRTCCSPRNSQGCRGYLAAPTPTHSFLYQNRSALARERGWTRGRSPRGEGSAGCLLKGSPQGVAGHGRERALDDGIKSSERLRRPAFGPSRTAIDEQRWPPAGSRNEIPRGEPTAVSAIQGARSSKPWTVTNPTMVTAPPAGSRAMPPSVPTGVRSPCSERRRAPRDPSEEAERLAERTGAGEHGPDIDPLESRRKPQRRSARASTRTTSAAWRREVLFGALRGFDRGSSVSAVVTRSRRPHRPRPPPGRVWRVDPRRPVAHPVCMQALKIQVMVDDTVVHALPALSPLRGQRVELIALGEAQPPSRVAPVAGGLLGQIKLKDNFDAPLPDDVRRAFEGDEP
jgi:hypothetical protein